MRRFRVKLKQEFDASLLPHVEEVFQSESLLQAVVYGHLLLERALTTLIGQKLRRKDILESRDFGTWSFRQKLGLYVGLYDPPEEQWKMLKGFNELRNKIAHRLDDAGVWVSKCLPWKEASPRPNPRSHLWTITAILFFELGILQEIEDETASASEEALSAQGGSDFRRDTIFYSAKTPRSLDDAICWLTGRTRRVCACDACCEARSSRSISRGGAVGDDRSKGADTMESPQRMDSDSDPHLELHFMHPHSSSRLVADVNPKCTGNEALSSLTSEGGDAFLPALPAGRNYQLVIHRTQHRIEPEMSFEEAGAIDGDWIDIQQSGCLGL